MTVYKFEGTVAEDHTIRGPDDLPPGRAEITVVLADVQEEPVGTEANARSIGEIIAEIMSDLPDEVLSRLPVDGAEQHDHYIYGLPKR